VDDRAELARYLDADGRIKAWPSKRQRSKQRLVLQYLASKFDPTVTYTEKAVNALLNQNHCFQDPALLRRELFEAGWLDRQRDGSAYWVNPQMQAGDHRSP
jgi:hypothetical protein